VPNPPILADLVLVESREAAGEIEDVVEGIQGSLGRACVRGDLPGLERLLLDVLEPALIRQSGVDSARASAPCAGL
jgi:hypothetical protein